MFSLPSLESNTSGWGPLHVAISDKKDDQSEVQSCIPFAPFNRMDRLGKVSDFMSSGGKFFNRVGGNRGKQFGQGSTTAFAYINELEEDSFSLVDTSLRNKAKNGKRKFTQYSVHNKKRRGRGQQQWTKRTDTNKNSSNKSTRSVYSRNTSNWGSPATEQREASYSVPSTWEEVSVIEFSDLTEKASNKGLRGVDVTSAGVVYEYDTKYNRVMPRSAVRLESLEEKEESYKSVTTSDDPIMQRLIKEGTGNVYGTDVIIATLMASTKSVFGWDLIIRKKDGNIIFDKRKESKLDLLQCNENWNFINENDKSSNNHSENLAMEATRINQSFVKQVLKTNEEPYLMKEDNPFHNNDAYMYRSFKLSDNFTLITRCSVSAFVNNREGEREFINIKALNEFDSKLSMNVDWRRQLAIQEGATLATEIKNNCNKVARWTAQTVLSGSNLTRMGFVSRATPSDSANHEVLMTREYKTSFLAQNIQLSVPNFWATLRIIVGEIQELNDGLYFLQKDANATKMHLYKVNNDEEGFE